MTTGCMEEWVTERREETLGARVQRLRNERGWSLDDLSFEARVNRGTLHLIERGKTTDPHPATLRAIGKAFGVDETYLLTGVIPPPRIDQWPEDIAVYMRGRGDLTDDDLVDDVRRLYERHKELERRRKLMDVADQSDDGSPVP